MPGEERTWPHTESTGELSPKLSLPYVSLHLSDFNLYFFSAVSHNHGCNSIQWLLQILSAHCWTWRQFGDILSLKHETWSWPWSLGPLTLQVANSRQEGCPGQYHVGDTSTHPKQSSPRFLSFSVYQSTKSNFGNYSGSTPRDMLPPTICGKV